MLLSRALMQDKIFSAVVRTRFGFQPVSSHVLSNVAVYWLKLHTRLFGDGMTVIQIV